MRISDWSSDVCSSDLFCMKPWSASIGAQKAARVNPPIKKTAVSSEKVCSRVPWSIDPSVLEQVVEDRVGQQGENQIIEAENAQPASLERLCDSSGNHRFETLCCADHARNQQRHRDQRADTVAQTGR